MKYHQRNDDNKFIISLALTVAIAVLVIAVPATRFSVLLGAFLP